MFTYWYLTSLYVIDLFGFKNIYEFAQMDILYITYLCSSYITLHKHDFGHIGLSYLNFILYSEVG